MNKEKTIKVCTGIGLNMFFPEYVEVIIPPSDDIINHEIVDEVKGVIKKRKNKKNV
jgi:hypothetical protein